MILNITIENYRSFKSETTFTLVAEPSKSKDQNIFIQNLPNEDQIKLLNTALIYGANASGKTNLLRCIFEIVKFISNTNIKVGEGIEAYDPFVLSKALPDKPVVFKIEFIGRDHIKYLYELSFNEKYVNKEVLTYYPYGKPRVLFERILDSENGNKIHIGRLGSDLKKKEIEVFNNQTILSKFGTDSPDKIVSEVFIYLNNIEVINACNTRKVSALRNEVAEVLLKNDPFKKKMDELIAFADTGLSGVQIKENDPNTLKFPENIPEQLKNTLLNDYKYVISGIHPILGETEEIIDFKNLPIEQESHGTKTLFSLGGKILNAIETGSVIFIDELETGLHSYLAKLLVCLFQNKRINPNNAQLIFTTHDTNLLDRTLFRKDQIWFVEKSKKGESVLYSLQDFNDVREDTPFDKWYLAGKFGGIPNIKSLEELFPELNEEK
jgi:AAA15 family ATPase/GTPase